MHDLREFDCVKGIGTTKVYAIAEPTTTDEALWEARDNKVEVKCFDFDTFWRVREVIEGKKSVVFSCRQRIERDIIERGRSIDSISDQYRKTVRPMFEKYIKSYINMADVIVARGGKNARIVEILSGYVSDELHKRQNRE